VLFRVKALDPTLPVIVLSGDEELSAVLNAVDQGAFAYVLKNDPDLRPLVSAVGRAAAHGRVMRENVRLTEMLQGANRELGRTNELLEQRVNERTSELRRANQALDARLNELRQAQSQLLLADRLASLGTLTAGVAHEINNPSTYIIGNLELLVEQLLAARQKSLPANELLDAVPRLLECAKEALSGALRVRDIVRDLRTFARSGDDEPAVADLHQVVQSAVHLTAHEVQPRAELRLEEGELPQVRGSASRLGQVVVNLLVNAVQAMPDRPRTENQVRLRTELRGDRVLLEVTDNGEGIAPDVLPRIFDPFFTTRPQGKGTGLGLSVCQGIVQDAGGTLMVESTPGRGTTVRVELCTEAAGRPAAPLDRRAAVTVSPLVATPRRRILIIDDDSALLLMLKRALAQHEVVGVRGGVRALELLLEKQSQDFDLILCDMMMPDLTGMDLHEKVVDARPDLADRFVFMTGGAFTARARNFLARLSVPVLEKPLRLSEIRALAAGATATGGDGGSNGVSS
jgi:signal transduction histidine kinase/ActR/RegA family two-component response regulator